MKDTTYSIIKSAINTDETLTESQKRIILLVAKNPNAVSKIKRKLKKKKKEGNMQHIVGAKVDEDTWGKTTTLRNKHGKNISMLIRPSIKRCIDNRFKEVKQKSRKEKQNEQKSK